MGDSSNGHTAARLALLARLLDQIESDLGLPLTRALISVALKPGSSINDLADQLNVPQQTASRYIAVLQGRYESPNGSIDTRAPLVSLEISQNDPRRRALFVTPEGKKRVAKLLAADLRGV